MSVGTLITVDSQMKIVKREPIWPFPPRENFPRTNADGTTTYFFPQMYFNFHLGETLHEKVDT